MAEGESQGHGPREPDFADFTEAFCAGWNAHREHGDTSAEGFAAVLMARYERSGGRLAAKVNAGVMTEADARAALAQPPVPTSRMCVRCGVLTATAIDVLCVGCGGVAERSS